MRYEPVGPAAAPLIKRYVLLRIWKLPRIYLHNICRSDYDRALHNHPWWFFSILLRGRYWEYLDKGDGKEEMKLRTAPSIVFRGLPISHRIELPINDSETSCWTLFITGPRVRPWGFFCEDGWRNSKGFEGCES